MKKLAILVAVVAMSSTPAWAKKEVASGGYKSAGCGLGSMIFQEEGFTQLLAATTNAWTGTTFFGITSGTSNCGGNGGFVKNDVQKEVYVSSNMEQLNQEMAQGQGEHLNALATLMGCEKDSAPQFSAVMKKNYRTVMSDDANQVIENVESQVKSDAALSKACHS